MKKLLAVLPILLLMLAIGIVPVGAAQQQAFPAELAYYDAQINVLIPRLNNFQAQYYAVNGRYYQALVSHETAPDVPTVPDGITSSPTDQPETLAYFWETFAELPDSLGWSFRIDTYYGPDGNGYVITISTLVDGETWERAVNYGPEAWRAAEWYHVVPFEF